MGMNGKAAQYAASLIIWTMSPLTPDLQGKVVWLARGTVLSGRDGRIRGEKQNIMTTFEMVNG